MTATSRKRLFAALRILICGAALWYVARGVTLDDQLTLIDGTVLRGLVSANDDLIVVTPRGGRPREFPRRQVAHDPDGSVKITFGLWAAWRTSRAGFLLVAVLLHLPVGFLQGYRFKILLAAQHIRMSFGDSVKLAFAGNFLNFAAPLGSNAGDVFKAYFVSLHTTRKTEAVTTVLLDRIIGLATLVLVVAAIAVFSPAGSRLAPFRNYVLMALAIGIVSIIVYLSPTLRRVLPGRLLSRLPGYSHLVRVDDAARSLARQPSAVVEAVLLTAALQALAMAAYFLVAVALGMQANSGNMLEYYAYFAAGAVIQALPGPPQGLGTVELAYRYFFAPFGSPSQIICFALAARLVVLVCALPGAWVAMTGAYRPQNAIRPVEPSSAEAANGAEFQDGAVSAQPAERT